MTHPVPEGFTVKGVSTYYNDDGEVLGQWVKSQQDPAARERLLDAAVAAMAEKIPREKASKAPARCNSDLLSCYTITDYHLGMLSWREETGADWDTNIAEKMLTDWFGIAVGCSPPSERAVLAQLGDFLHWDGMDAVTPEHRNLLDADTRFQKIVRVAIRVLRRVIAMLLAKHAAVHVIMGEGNHDPASSIWLRELFAALYEDEPRVTIDKSPDPYYCVEHGDTSLFFHHGHKRKPKNIADIFAAKFRGVFGRTKFSYAHLGHKHCVEVLETSLMLIEQHRTLAAPDAYASRGGWISGRDAQVIVYSKQFGEIARNRINSRMVEDRGKAA